MNGVIHLIHHRVKMFTFTTPCLYKVGNQTQHAYEMSLLA